MTGRRNRAHAAAKFGKLCLPNWFFPPCAPADLSRRESRYLPRLRGKYFFLLALYMDYKNWIAKVFIFSEQPQSSVLTSFGCCSICLRKFFSCGASWAPPPTRLWEVLLKFPATHRPNKLIFMKVFAQPFTKGWKVFAKLFSKSVKVGARSFFKRPGACVLSSEIGFADFVAGGKLGAGA